MKDSNTKNMLAFFVLFILNYGLIKQVKAQNTTTNTNNCTSHCLKCLDNVQCLVCDQSNFYFLDNQNQCRLIQNCTNTDTEGKCTVCLAPFYPQNGICQIGQQISNCREKTSDIHCKTCNDKYYQQNGQCYQIQNVIANCKYYGQQNQCLQCQEGYVLNSTNKCIQKLYSCQLHQNVTCQQCKEGFYLSKNIQFDYLQILISGIYKIIYYESCLPLQIVENCIKYNNLGQCEICAEKHYLEENRCIFLPPIKYNIILIDNCRRYLKKNQCYQCNFNFQLSQDRTQCLPIVQQVGCLGYSSLEFINQCSACSQNYYKNQNKQCQIRQNYPIQYCATYDESSDMCLNCQEQFQLQQDNTICASKNCKNFANGLCQECEDLYYLDQNICQRGSVENCIKYQTDQNICQTCDYQNRYMLQNNQCVQIGEEIQNCQSYDKNLKCQTCDENSLPLYIQNNCVQQQRRLQAVLDCELPLVSNYNGTDCVEEKFQNCSNHDDIQCYMCIEEFVLYEGVCIEKFTHFTQNCQVQNEQFQNQYLDYIVDYLINGDQTQYLEVHDESNYGSTDDLLALRYDDYLQTKQNWTEQNKTLIQHQINRKNYTNLKFVKNKENCDQCTENSFPAFTLGYCVDKKYVQKQEFYTEGCQSYYEENCIQCHEGYYLTFEYFLMDQFKIQLQKNSTITEDNITINGNKEKENKYGYMYKTFCTKNCNNIAEKGLINTPIYSKYLQFLNSGSFFRFDSNAKFTTSRAEIVLVQNLCLDEFDKQQDLDDGVVNGKWKGCSHVSSSLLAINHISKPYRSSTTSNEQFSIFQLGKGLPKNSHNLCSRCKDGYVKLFDLNYKDYKNSVVIDLDTTPTTESNPFVKYILGHHCINKENEQIFELLENCDMYTIESFPTNRHSPFHYQKQDESFSNLAEKIFRNDATQDIKQLFQFDYKNVNEMNRNFVQGSKYKTKFVCVKCKFGYRDNLEPQKNFSIAFSDQCTDQQRLQDLPNALQNFFQQEYEGIPIWIFEGYQTQEEFRQDIMFFMCHQQGIQECVESPEMLIQIEDYENTIIEQYSMQFIIENNLQGLKIECSQCQNSFKLHTKVDTLNMKLTGLNNLEVAIQLDVNFQNCYAPKRYFENCQAPIEYCDTSRQLEPGIDPKSHFFSCHFCLPKNGVEQAPVMNIKGMNLLLNVSKFQEEIFTNHNYKLDPEFSKRKGYEVLNQPYVYLSPLNDLVDSNNQNPDHFISCWPIQKLQPGWKKSLQDSQRDKTIYIHQGDDIAEMNYRMFTFEKVQTGDSTNSATNYLKEDQGQLYKGVYCKNSSFYYTFDFESLNQVAHNNLANGDLDIGKMLFNYFMQGLLENPTFSCTNNLTPSNIKKSCVNYKENADGICLDEDLNFGIQVTQHYDQLRNRLRNFPLLFTDKELQEYYDKDQNNKFITHSQITKELFESASRNYEASIHLMGYDGSNLETAYNQLPFILGNGQNDFFNYGIFHQKNNIQNCAVEGWLRKSIDLYQPMQQFSFINKNLQVNGEFNPFQSDNEVCSSQFSFEKDGINQCYYYASYKNYENFYDYLDLTKNQLNSIGCLRCKDGYELVDNNKSCQRIQIPNCQKTNNILKNSNSLVTYVVDNMFVNSYFGIQEGIGCSQCDQGYISLNDNEIQFYQDNTSELNSISNKIDYAKIQFTHKNQMCIQIEKTIQKIENCKNYGIDFTKELKDKIYICHQCHGSYQPSANKSTCILYPDNCLTANEIDGQVKCTQCNEGYLLNEQNYQCIQAIPDCQQHSFDSTGNVVCTLCNNGQVNQTFCQNIENCQMFNSENLCAQCNDQYQNFQTKCVLVPQNCQLVDINGICQNCVSNQYQIIQNECVSLPQNCLEIDQNLQCQKCEVSFVLHRLINDDTQCIFVNIPQQFQTCQNYELQNNINNLTCTDCVSNDFILQNLQEPQLICHIQQIENCQEYEPSAILQDQFLCKKCKEEKILLNNECQLNRNLVDNCLIYETYIDECQECQQGYILVQVNGNSQKQCVIDQNIKNCIQYTEDYSQCQQCQAGYILNNNQSFCSDPNCSIYNNDECIQCNLLTHYLLDGNCIQRIEGCDIHNSDQTCKQCLNGFYLDQNQNICIQSTFVQNCEIYNAFEDMCDLCVLNYHLSEQQLSCIINQEQQHYNWIEGCYLYGSQTECKVCQFGNYLNEQYECVSTTIQISNCDIYSQDSECKECSGEYQLHNNQCVLADSNNCIEYLSNYYDNQICGKCKEGYVLSFDGNCLKKSDYLNSNQEFQYSIYLQENINIDEYISNLTLYEQVILTSQNCKTFNENQICIQCVQDYYLTLQNKCVYLNQNTNCELLKEQQLECLSCNDGYVKNDNGECVYDSESSGCLFTYDGNCKMCNIGVYDYACSLEN